MKIKIKISATLGTVTKNQIKWLINYINNISALAHYAGAIMHAISMDILSTERCKELLLNTDFGVDIADRILCATPKEGKNNVCDADIGGPLACQNEDGSYELAGIYSQDTGCYPSNQVRYT
mgnify:CR=1 FL=1